MCIEGGYFKELNVHFSLQESYWITGKTENQGRVGTSLKVCLMGLSTIA